MRMYDIIKKKRDGEELNTAEIDFFIKGYTDGSIPDYQASALIMAIFFSGMTARETTDLTLAMARSGEMMDLSLIDGETVDKHSTGGVGDKTTLIVAPIVAALGCKVAKMSGRGLGHTGGTVDKLESIPGFKVELSPERFLKQVNEIGICVIGQSGNLTPADKKLYALRDVTACIESIPLIASSVMSKKLAGGSQHIVLDVKCGSGAFIKDLEDAKELAVAMVKIGDMAGRKTNAVITNMDIPLGYYIGNTLEVIEAIEILKGEGCKDLKELCFVLASLMYSSCKGIDLNSARKEVEEVVLTGKALLKFKEMVKAQGGDVSVIDDVSKFEESLHRYEIKAPRDGYISRMNAEQIGIASVVLGAGREKKDDPIDYKAGIVLVKKTGDYVNKGEPIAILFTDLKDKIAEAEKLYINALKFSASKPKKQSLIYKIVRSISE
ncbi:MAG: pyrimidine-nucleoside phosphorylase [Ruminococcaceae bacterium]|nr:pyrimidine-nucleoside phosphorylase [Oscillospiraceae bacterium]